MRVGLSSESWAPKNCCFWNVVLEKTLESPLDCKEIKPVHPKVNQPWVCIGRTHAEAEAPILWPPDVKGLHIGKDSDAGKAWGQEEKRMTEDKIIGWHHQLNGNKFEQTPANSEGQGNLVWCNSWGCRVRHDWVTVQQTEAWSRFLTMKTKKSGWDQNLFWRHNA